MGIYCACAGAELYFIFTSGLSVRIFICARIHSVPKCQKPDFFNIDKFFPKIVKNEIKNQFITQFWDVLRDQFLIFVYRRRK